MSLDPSLKSAGALVRHRNVLTRAERLERLQSEEKWSEDKAVFGLPKVANRKLEVAKADKEEAAAEGATATAGATATPAAAAGKDAKGAAPAKAAAPAKDAKAAKK